MIDVLVNCVGGGGRPRKFMEKPREECKNEINLTYWSVIHCTKAVLDHMIARRYGKIINIGSPAAQSGLAGRMAAVYGGAKGAVTSFSKALAWELGSCGINVNVVVPGWTIPESREDVASGSFWKKGFNFYSPEIRERALKYQPIQRLCRPEDIADMIVFLVSDRASYVTGQTISVSGGATMW